MGSQVIVEVLDGRGRVHSRARLTQFPATIGRGFSSDVILDDPYVDAEHLRLLVGEDGGLVMEDMRTMNGTFESGNRVRATRIAMRPGLELRVGRTHLRFQDAEQPAPPALPIRGEGFYSRLSDPRIAIPTAIVLVIWFGISGWLGAYERDEMSKQFMTGVYIFLFALVWAAAWALGSRVILQRFNFVAHLTLAGLLLLAFEVVSVVSTWLGVMLPHTHIDTALSWIAGLPLAFALLAGHLALASAMTRRDRYRTTAGVMVSVMAIAGLASWSSRDDFSSALKYSATIRPLPVSMMHTTPADDFFREVGELREEVDTLAARANRKQRSR